MSTAASSKLEHVRTWFEATDKYLDPRQFDIRIRRETVKEFLGLAAFEKALDIGCGDGSLSLPFIRQIEDLTLLDVSRNMLSRAAKNIPGDCADKVKLINSGFLDAKLAPGGFDLVMCIGVLAHVDSPRETIAEVARVARPNASVILEFTDSYHFWSAPVILYQNLLKLRRPAPYHLNRLRRQSILGLCRQYGFYLRRVYRYGHPPMGTGCFVGQESLFGMTRYLFGPPAKNRNCWMGNQFIYLLQKK